MCGDNGGIAFVIQAEDMADPVHFREQRGLGVGVRNSTRIRHEPRRTSNAAAWKDQAFRVRMLATPHLIQINTGFTGDFSLLLSNNAATGGTCYGDSGGPNFVGTSKVIGGVTSYGLNAACGGTGGVFRVDRQNVQDFITSPTIVPY